MYCIKTVKFFKVLSYRAKFQAIFFLLFLKAAINIGYNHRACEMQSEL